MTCAGRMIPTHRALFLGTGLPRLMSGSIIREALNLRVHPRPMEGSKHLMFTESTLALCFLLAIGLVRWRLRMKLHEGVDSSRVQESSPHLQRSHPRRS